MSDLADGRITAPEQASRRVFAGWLRQSTSRTTLSLPAEQPLEELRAPHAMAHCTCLRSDNNLAGSRSNTRSPVRPPAVVRAVLLQQVAGCNTDMDRSVGCKNTNTDQPTTTSHIFRHANHGSNVRRTTAAVRPKTKHGNPCRESHEPDRRGAMAH